jgi:hypothetical protein
MPEPAVPRRPPALQAALDAEVGAVVREAGRRRTVITALRLGSPGRRGPAPVVIAEDSSYDAGLRSDLVERALEEELRLAQGPPLPWLTRSGGLVMTDADAAWSAATRAGYARHGLPFPGFYVITLAGWMDLDAARVRPLRVRRSPRRS